MDSLCVCVFVSSHLSALAAFVASLVSSNRNQTAVSLRLFQCQSIKLLSARQADHLETRDAWWNEVRDEIRSHAAALGCWAVLGYTETARVAGDLLLMIATGTAVVLRSAVFDARTRMSVRVCACV